MYNYGIFHLLSNIPLLDDAFYFIIKYMKPEKLNGFSLVEMMVALVIMGVASMGFMTMLSQVSEQQKVAIARQDLINISLEVQSMFASRTLCPSGFVAGNNFDEALATKVYTPNGATPFEGMPFQYKINGDTLGSGATLKNYAVNVDKMFLLNATKVDNDTAGRPVYLADVMATFVPKSGNTSFAVRSLVSAFFTVNGSALIECGLTPPPTIKQASETCRSLGGAMVNNSCLLPGAGNSGDVNSSMDVAQIPNDPNFMSALCKNLGGTLTGTQCSFAGAPGGSSGTPVAGKWKNLSVTGSCPNTKMGEGTPCSPIGLVQFFDPVCGGKSGGICVPCNISRQCQ